MIQKLAIGECQILRNELTLLVTVFGATSRIKDGKLVNCREREEMRYNEILKYNDKKSGLFYEFRYTGKYPYILVYKLFNGKNVKIEPKWIKVVGCV